MSKLTNKEEIERMQVLYEVFHSKILTILKKQAKLFERSIKLVDEKKLKEIRRNIKKS